MVKAGVSMGVRVRARVSFIHVGFLLLNLQF